MQIAVDRLVDARWTDEIHDEWIRNLVARAPGIPIERLQITRKLMNDAPPDATVVGYQAHLDAITLPDPDDRHVVAAAITAGVSVMGPDNVASRAESATTRRMRPAAAKTDIVSATFRKRL